MSENQKLREALSELIEAYNRAGPELSRAERAVDRMRLIAAHEALALPTAAPVGEREAFEELIEEFEAAAIDKHDCRNPEYQFEHRAYDAACQRYDAARAALSAGDAVDGQSNASRWVASADRYPPEGERVFFMDLATNIVGFDMWAGEGFMWMPSHWMPIPPAPAMRKGQL